MSYFNSQPHEEADLRDPVFKNSLYISTHSLTKRLTNKSVIGALNELFQLTASRRGWPFCFPPFVLSWYFNSQPHEEADVDNPDPYIVNSISTHSLTKRLTDILILSQNSVSISNHSLTKRLTVTSAWYPLFWLFQLTASRRGWRPLTRRKMWLPHYFNSQPHEEADASLVICIAWEVIFQLTASRRGWRNVLGKLRHWEDFNSQPHEEADGVIFLTNRTYTISTHSLTKRLTKASEKSKASNSFQLTASRRGWRDVSDNTGFILVFQLTASRRGWL